MNQIICYIYEYEKNRRIRNAGFLKIQSRYRKYLVQMHMKGLPLSDNEVLALYIFQKDGNDAVEQKLLDLHVKNHSVNTQLTISGDLLPQAKQLQEFDGFLLHGPNHKIYMAAWVNVSIDTTKIRKFEEVSAVPAAETDVPVMEAEQTEPKPHSPLNKMDTPAEDAASSIADVASGIVDAASSIAETSETRSTAIKTDISETPPQSKYHKITRSELSVLPRKYWNLANNNFLLHGFYNYHHLLLIEEEDCYIVGVPGIYDRKEARAADLFGFSDFSNDYLKELTLTEEESSYHKRFGHWCRTIPKSNTPQ